MTPELEELLELARHYKMTPKERYDQRVSFIYGMQKLSEPGYTVEQIKAALAEQGVLDPALCTDQNNGDILCRDPNCPLWRHVGDS